jgi:hypothetical protein
MTLHAYLRVIKVESVFSVRIQLYEEVLLTWIEFSCLFRSVSDRLLNNLCLFDLHHESSSKRMHCEALFCSKIILPKYVLHVRCKCYLLLKGTRFNFVWCFYFSEVVGVYG